MRFWANVVGYQLVWLAVVWSAGAGRPALGIAASVAFVGLQLAASRERGADLGLVATALACGLALDGALARGGAVHYAGNDGLWPAPAWILSLWAAFAMTFDHSLVWLHGRTAAAALLGGIGGPLAYLAAERFGAITISAPPATAIAAIAVGWAIAIALLATLAAKWSAARAADARA